MPNWVHNTLIVKKGDPQQVWDAIRGRRDGDRATPFTFNRVVPMPAAMRNCGEMGTKADLSPRPASAFSSASSTNATPWCANSWTLPFRFSGQIRGK